MEGRDSSRKIVSCITPGPCPVAIIVFDGIFQMAIQCLAPFKPSSPNTQVLEVRKLHRKIDKNTQIQFELMSNKSVFIKVEVSGALMLL